MDFQTPEDIIRGGSNQFFKMLPKTAAPIIIVLAYSVAFSLLFHTVLKRGVRVQILSSLTVRNNCLTG